MGKRGPKKTPTETLRRRGSWRGDQRTGEPQPETDGIVAPDGLNPAALELWNQVVARLRAMNVMTVADVFQMERYCRLFVRWRLAELKLEEEGETIILFEPDSEFDPAEETSIEELGLAEKFVKLLAGVNCRYCSDLEQAIEDGLLTNIKGIGPATSRQIEETYQAWRADNPVSREIKYEQQRPEVAIVANLSKELRAIEDRFGLSPSARADLHIAEGTVDKMQRDRQQEVRELIAGKVRMGGDN